MSYYKILGFAMVSLTAIFILKRVKEEYAVLLSVLSGVILTGFGLSLLSPVIEFTLKTIDSHQNKELSLLLIKASGIAIITNVGSDLCKDCGEGSLGGRLELCGKALILSMALPLIESIFQYCTALLNL